MDRDNFYETRLLKMGQWSWLVESHRCLWLEYSLEKTKNTIFYLDNFQMHCFHFLILKSIPVWNRAQFSNVLSEKYDRMFHFNWIKLSELTEIKYFHIKNLNREGFKKIFYFYFIIHSVNFYLGNTIFQDVVGGEFALNCWFFLYQNYYFGFISGAPSDEHFFSPGKTFSSENQAIRYVLVERDWILCFIPL